MITSHSAGLLRNIFHLGLGQVVTTILTMVLSAAVARTLGAEEFGLLYLLTSIGAFAYVFVDWGYGPYVIGETAKRPGRSGELLGTVLLVRAATAAAMCVLSVLFTRALGYDLRTQILAAGIIAALLPQYLGLTYAWVFRGRERMDYDATVQVVLKASSVVITLTVLALGGRLVALLPVSAAAGIVASGTAIVLYRRLALPSLQVSRATARELAYRGAPMMAIAVAVAVQPYIDANLLYTLAPTEVVGWYGAAWAVAGTLVAPASVISAAVYPRLARASDDPIEFGRALRLAFRPLLFVAVLGGVGAFTFADLAIGIIYGLQKFGQAADTLRSFAPVLVLIYIDMLFGYAIVAAGKAGRLAQAKVLAVVVTSLCELLLIPLLQASHGNGGIGIMLSMVCGELVMVIASLMLLRDIIHRTMLADMARALAAGAATIALLNMLPAMTPFLAIPVSVVSFGIVALAVGLISTTDMAFIGQLAQRKSDPTYPPSTDPIATVDSK